MYQIEGDNITFTKCSFVFSLGRKGSALQALFYHTVKIEAEEARLQTEEGGEEVLSQASRLQGHFK